MKYMIAIDIETSGSVTRQYHTVDLGAFSGCISNASKYHSIDEALTVVDALRQIGDNHMYEFVPILPGMINISPPFIPLPQWKIHNGYQNRNTNNVCVQLQERAKEIQSTQ